MARTKQFKTESRKLLELMIHSIYTNQEIFLRELISNASDALDKRYFQSAEKGEALDKQHLNIRLHVNKEARTLTIQDNGIGMDEQELEQFLGTIAKSDSRAFKEALEEQNPDVDVIGQFGVGFYSAFMVSERVEVFSRKQGSDQGWKFSSDGIEGFKIEAADVASSGTSVICYLRPDTEEDHYSDYLEGWKLRSLVKTYSDYIRYPILMVDEEGKEETLNSMVPLWKRARKDVSEEELNQFYKDKFHDAEDPLIRVMMRIEGNPSFEALLFIPAHVPYNFYTTQFEAGLQLYSRNVFIMEHNKDLIPEAFRFVRGLVDSPDLSLNISREILQHDRQLKQIANRIEKRIRQELEKLLKDDRPTYEGFWKAFGLQIKYGVYADFGARKDELQDLLMFTSSHEDQLVTLAEYVARMKEDQKEIYYVSADSLAKAKLIPQTELLAQKGYEILYLSDDVDEFILQVINQYQEKPFRNAGQGTLDLEDETTRQKLEEKTTENKNLLEQIKEALGDKVKEVRLSARLVSHPVCLVSDEGLSFEMEKVLSQMPEGQDAPKAGRILELNPDHPLLSGLDRVAEKDPKKLKDYAEVLYDQACLLEGLPIDDPAAFSRHLSELMVDASQNQ